MSFYLRQNQPASSRQNFHFGCIVDLVKVMIMLSLRLSNRKEAEAPQLAVSIPLLS
jgi:hypothetical protein